MYLNSCCANAATALAIEAGGADFAGAPVVDDVIEEEQSTESPFNTPCTHSRSLSRCASNGNVTASSQCGVLTKYSRLLERGTSSTRSGRIRTPLFTARSISRRTCAELLECEEKTKTMSAAELMASIISSAQSLLGEISRGAIQRGIPEVSSLRQIELA